MSLSVLAALAACRDRGASAGDGGADAGADVAATTPVGAACAGDGECGGGACVRSVERACEGPVRPHAWRLEFPGGYCTRAGFDAVECPAGAAPHGVVTGCDGLRYRFCARRCASDAECRVSDGYACERESGQCLPPALAPPRDGG